MNQIILYNGLRVDVRHLQDLQYCMSDALQLYGAACMNRTANATLPAAQAGVVSGFSLYYDHETKSGSLQGSAEDARSLAVDTKGNVFELVADSDMIDLSDYAPGTDGLPFIIWGTLGLTPSENRDQVVFTVGIGEEIKNLASLNQYTLNIQVTGYPASPPASDYFPLIYGSEWVNGIPTWQRCGPLRDLTVFSAANDGSKPSTFADALVSMAKCFNTDHFLPGTTRAGEHNLCHCQELILRNLTGDASVGDACLTNANGSIVLTVPNPFNYFAGSISNGGGDFFEFTPTYAKARGPLRYYTSQPFVRHVECSTMAAMQTGLAVYQYLSPDYYVAVPALPNGTATLAQLDNEAHAYDGIWYQIGGGQNVFNGGLAIRRPHGWWVDDETTRNGGCIIPRLQCGMEWLPNGTMIVNGDSVTMQYESTEAFEDVSGSGTATMAVAICSRLFSDLAGRFEFRVKAYALLNVRNAMALAGSSFWLSTGAWVLLEQLADKTTNEHLFLMVVPYSSTGVQFHAGSICPKSLALTFRSDSSRN